MDRDLLRPCDPCLNLGKCSPRCRVPNNCDQHRWDAPLHEPDVRRRGIGHRLANDRHAWKDCLGSVCPLSGNPTRGRILGNSDRRSLESGTYRPLRRSGNCTRNPERFASRRVDCCRHFLIRRRCGIRSALLRRCIARELQRHSITRPAAVRPPQHSDWRGSSRVIRPRRSSTATTS
jgi:hypothetical protein